MYYKRCTGCLLARKTDMPPRWVEWVHEPGGVIHCLECLQLNGCWFAWEKEPICPHHEKCHCRLEAVDYQVVLANASAYSDYSKFDPYLFNTTGLYFHNKEKLFNEWGYTVDDAKWLQAEMERQAREKYTSGEYELGKLNVFGQRINIVIEIPRKDKEGTVTFLSGWMVEPGGKLKLNTPYGGK